MSRYMDHIAATFGTGPGQKRGYCGHQEIELALYRLYTVDRNRKYLDLATYFINERGQQPHFYDGEAIARGENPKDFGAKTYEYNQSHLPVREQTRVVGHAVRAMYMFTAMADLAAELNDDSLTRTLEILWKDVTSKQMYVTGGIGPSKHNEGFTSYYDLPNETAYCETCASVALIFWAQRMLNINLEGKYADVMETCLYNGALSGLSRDGTHYFYENPLESDGTHKRWTWHHCPCCTMNVSRLVASVGGYFYSTSSDAIAVHGYGGTATRVTVAGTEVSLRETSNYPWSGDVRLVVDPANPAEFSMKLRIPGWARSADAGVNGEKIDVAANTKSGYLEIRRTWNPGDTIVLSLPMPVERVYANPNVRQDAGRAAIKRGPLVYCIEQVDNTAPVARIRNPPSTNAEPVHREDLFGGITTVVAEGAVAPDDDWGDTLYRTAPPKHAPQKWTAVPYYIWNNREPGRMLVWIPEA